MMDHTEIQSSPDHGGEPKAPYRYSPMPDDAKYIRLVHIRPGVEGDSLQVELLTQSFDLGSDIQVSYEALSYVWGPKDNLEQLMVGIEGSHSVSVTKNLFEALTHLRYPHYPRVMWIDAISIDQGNVAERSKQVAIMGKIFERASSVVIWLGPEANDSEWALRKLRGIGSKIHVDKATRKMTALYGDTALCDSSLRLPLYRAEVEAIVSLIHRQWFERVWIRQEVILAREAFICAGTRSIPWEHFKNAIHCIYTRRGGASDSNGEGDRFYLVTRICYYKHYSLLHLRDDLRFAKCEDPRDRVYAVLSLLNEEDQGHGIVPDYATPIHEVYRDIALRKMMYDQDLNLLSTCSLQEQRLPNLPTWVPDWSTSPPFVDLLSPNCGGDVFYSSMNYLANGVLSVAGINHSTVSWMVYFPPDPGFPLLEHMQTLWEELNLSQSLDQPYVTGGLLVDAVCRAIFRDRFNEYSQGWDARSTDFTDAKNIMIKLANDARWRHIDPASLQFRERFLSYMQGRCFFITADGHVGCGPLGLQLGDHVSMLLGCQMPVLLRTVSTGRYQVVGECYLHGIMSGEPLLGALPSNVRQIGDRDTKYAYRYLNLDTGQLTLLDPRLERLPIDLDQHKDRLRQGKWCRIAVKPDVLISAGVNIQMFELV